MALSGLELINSKPISKSIKWFKVQLEANDHMFVNAQCYFFHFSTIYHTRKCRAELYMKIQLYKLKSSNYLIAVSLEQSFVNRKSSFRFSHSYIIGQIRLEVYQCRVDRELSVGLATAWALSCSRTCALFVAFTSNCFSVSPLPLRSRRDWVDLSASDDDSICPHWNCLKNVKVIQMYTFHPFLNIFHQRQCGHWAEVISVIVLTNPIAVVSFGELGRVLFENDSIVGCDVPFDCIRIEFQV